MLKLNSVEVSPFLVHQLTEDKHFTEHKLKMIENFIDVMDDNSKILLLDQLSELGQKPKPNEFNNYHAFFVTSPPMVRALAFRMA